MKVIEFETGGDGNRRTKKKMGDWADPKSSLTWGVGLI